MAGKQEGAQIRKEGLRAFFAALTYNRLRMAGKEGACRKIMLDLSGDFCPFIGKVPFTCIKIHTILFKIATFLCFEY